MAEKKLIVEWTDIAIESLNLIHLFYINKSKTAADKMVAEIIATAESIQYPEQYQVDDINPKYRRMIVSHFKILYLEVDGTINIADIIDTRQSPEILKNK